ncbi:unnamed protein product [Tetraodon nigroviridis]|uniref:(spotted green pufferfish) hypothetical protein n=1 Tax=Tetraodon nigroviridis TaxID=99883 RepID=Q4RH66_TETNG|nr:unnamed protein product [Tetraodon nigroviridis]
MRDSSSSQVFQLAAGTRGFLQYRLSFSCPACKEEEQIRKRIRGRIAFLGTDRSWKRAGKCAAGNDRRNSQCSSSTFICGTRRHHFDLRAKRVRGGAEAQTLAVAFTPALLNYSSAVLPSSSARAIHPDCAIISAHLRAQEMCGHTRRSEGQNQTGQSGGLMLKDCETGLL